MILRTLKDVVDFDAEVWLGRKVYANPNRPEVRRYPALNANRYEPFRVPGQLLGVVESVHRTAPIGLRAVKLVYPNHPTGVYFEFGDIAIDINEKKEVVSSASEAKLKALTELDQQNFELLRKAEIASAVKGQTPAQYQAAFRTEGDNYMRRQQDLRDTGAWTDGIVEMATDIWDRLKSAVGIRFAFLAPLIWVAGAVTVALVPGGLLDRLFGTAQADNESLRRKYADLYASLTPEQRSQLDGLLKEAQDAAEPSWWDKLTSNIGTGGLVLGGLGLAVLFWPKGGRS